MLTLLLSSFTLCKILYIPSPCSRLLIALLFHSITNVTGAPRSSHLSHALGRIEAGRGSCPHRRGSHQH